MRRYSTGAREELRLRDATREVIVQRWLHVALEHLEGEHDGAAELRDCDKRLDLGAVRIGIVMLLAEEDDIGMSDAGEHLR